ncbi:MAG: hypothetical protein AUH81_18470 [Candidatus Rokubacteria bacterium 13_1_40CM_4_69_5]|nr:MAG: hypothetical protein AUH81_18470 [Candidatus Rokubacteria bacterium 13_1_40CM_4_69_5]
MPPELRGDHDYSTFGLGELLFFEPYTQAEFEEAIRFAESWGLTGHIRNRRYEALTMTLA